MSPSITNREVSAQEFVRDWAITHGHSGDCAAHVAPTTDRKIIITAVDSKDWLELPGADPEQPISRSEREQISDWLKQKFS
jgi:hypothetical protein